MAPTISTTLTMVMAMEVPTTVTILTTLITAILRMVVVITTTITTTVITVTATALDREVHPTALTILVRAAQKPTQPLQTKPEIPMCATVPVVPFSRKPQEVLM